MEEVHNSNPKTNQKVHMTNQEPRYYKDVNSYTKWSTGSMQHSSKFQRVSESWQVDSKHYMRNRED